ncbi:HD domain-containing protein [Patescibacteria group bacterium]
MKKSLNVKFEKAVRMLAEHMPVSDETSRKPVMFHDIRVGVYLYESGYSEDVVLAGVLHDVIEWSEVTEEMVRDEFGDEVLRLILASTKDDSIESGDEKNKELIRRCVENGQNALIIKAADLMDSFKWYFMEDNQDQLQGHCVKNANLILDNLPEDFDDEIFDELKEWRDEVSN